MFLSRQSKSQNQHQQAVFDAFKEHWKQVLIIFNRPLINDNDIHIVKTNLSKLMSILLDELNQLTIKQNVKLSSISTQDEPNVLLNDNSFRYHNDNNLDIYGLIWEYALKNNIFEVIFLWSLSYPEYLYDLKHEQLKYYENLISQMQVNDQTNILLYQQMHRPLFSLLNHCSTHNSEQIENYMISILNQLCVCICKNSHLLNIFFEQQNQKENNQNSNNSSGVGGVASKSNSNVYYKSNNNSNTISPLKNNSSNMTASTPAPADSRRTNATAKFFIFSLLIPYIHKEGSLGQQARDALLMIMQLSARNVNLARYVVDSTDFCPILATGLSGLYSELPQKLTSNENFDEIRYLQKEDIANITALNKFINSLEFCNNVIQVSHSLIANQLLQYVYYGFLVPVIAPALTQDVDNYRVQTVHELAGYANCMDEIIAATTYLDLFLRTINEPNLLKVFLKFILYSKFDEKITLLDTLINRINSNSKLSLVTLMLFYTMIDLNSEDVMYKLILNYLMPCKHLMQSQVAKLKQSSYEINGINAQTLLTLSTEFDSSDGNTSLTSNEIKKTNPFNNLNENSSVYKWLNSTFEKNELNTIISYLDGMRFNFVDYLKDAKSGILYTIQKTYKWSSCYDVPTSAQAHDAHDMTNGSKTNSLDTSKGSKNAFHDLDCDAEEYLLNLNIFSSSLSDTAEKSTRSTMNLFAKDNDESEGVDYEASSTTETDTFGSDDAGKSKRKVKKNTKEIATNKNRRTTTEDIFESSILSQKFDKNIEEGLETNKNELLNEEDLAKKEKKRQKKERRRNRAVANDFYVLSFDNELSETSSSSSEDSSLNENGNKNQKSGDLDDEDDDLTATSISSSITLNNDSNSLNSSNLNQSGNGLTPQVEIISNREQLVDYLFSNEEDKKIHLNGNLNNFLNALDDFFTKNNIPLSKQNKSAKTEKLSDMNLLCDQIMSIYNEFFTVQAKTDKEHSVPLEDEPNKTENLELTPNLTTFPVYDSLNSSTYSSINHPVDSGIESTSSVPRENDIGPFLCALLNRLDHMLSNSLQVNFLVTGLLARLAYFPQLMLRSFLLNHNLVMQPNVKSLFQIIGNVRYKIDHCSRTYENFSLLYLKAKLFLVKRLIDSKSNMAAIEFNKSKSQSSQANQSQTPGNTTPTTKKKSKMDKFLSIFFKPLVDITPTVNNQEEEDYTKSSTFAVTPFSPISTKSDSSFQENKYFNYSPELLTPQVELDLNDVKTKFSKNNKQTDTIQLKQLNNDIYDFAVAENEWSDTNTRNIAFSAVIYDEFIKELAAICQEHCLLSQEY